MIIERSRESLAQRGQDAGDDTTPVTLSPAVAALTTRAKPVAGRRQPKSKFSAPSCQAYLSLGSNVEPENNLRIALAALRARFGEVVVSPVYRTAAVGFEGPDFLNAVAVIDSDIHPFALNDWLHALEEAQGRDRRDASYSDRPLDIDIIYFGDLVLDGPGEFQLPRPELRHAFVLKPLADVAPDFVDPIRNATPGATVGRASGARLAAATGRAAALASSSNFPACRPPSRRSTWPVMYVASRSSQRTASAISSGVPRRCNGVRASSAALAASSLPPRAHQARATGSRPVRPHSRAPPARVPAPARASCARARPCPCRRPRARAAGVRRGCRPG